MTLPVYFSYQATYDPLDSTHIMFTASVANAEYAALTGNAPFSNDGYFGVDGSTIDQIVANRSVSQIPFVIADINAYFGSTVVASGGFIYTEPQNYTAIIGKQDHSGNLDNFSGISMVSDIKTNILQAASLAAMASNIATPISTALALDGAAFKPVSYFAAAFTGTTSQYTKGDGTYATFPSIPAAQVNSDWNSVSGVSQILNKPTIPSVTRTTSTLSLSLVGTGATGTQISSTKDSAVRLSTSTSTTSTIGGPSTSLVVLKKCATNNATEGSWTTVATLENDQTITLAIVLNSTQVLKGQLSADIPAGWYVKLVNSGTGTHSEAFVSGEQTIYG